MFKKMILATSLVGSLATPIYACTKDGKKGIAEENNLWISADQKSNGVTEQMFNDALDRIDQIYTPILDARKKKLKIDRNWEDGTVNAYARQTGKTWTIAMFGGLARHPEATIDGFAMVACHEMGHHIGGAPKKKTFWSSSSWASNEGQSDYWGAAKCFRKYMEFDNNVELMKDIEVPTTVETKCNANFTNAEDVAMCYRGSMAGQSLSRVLGALSNTPADKITFDTPDPKEVSRTNHNHPAAQCRLDTYFAGAICAIDHNEEVDDKDETVNVCTRVAGDVDGVRPRCWFMPNKA